MEWQDNEWNPASRLAEQRELALLRAYEAGQS
jgi:hypothetical protein